MQRSSPIRMEHFQFQLSTLVCFDTGVCKPAHCVKKVRIRSFSGPYFPAFRLNTERYSGSLRIQSKCRKIRTRKTPNTNLFYAVAGSFILLSFLLALFRIRCQKFDKLHNSIFFNKHLTIFNSFKLYWPLYFVHIFTKN